MPKRDAGTLAGQTALLTGAPSESGVAIARALTSAGASVVALELDARRTEELEARLDAIEREHGRIDVLVHHPRLEPAHDLSETTLEEWRTTVDAALTGAFLFVRAVVRRMIASGTGGTIVNVASTLGHRARPHAVAACAAAGGLLNLTRALAVELGPYGIRVNSVSPSPDGAGAQLPRGAEARHVAAAVLFLVSDAASFTTGTDLRVDGGALATWGDGRGSRGR